MQTRRDQLHAYRFMTRRAMSSLVTGEPDAVEPPMRRLTVMTISGIMVAIVVAAVFAVIGLLKGGGGDQWRNEGAVVLEEETGARYVNIGGTLFPALNYSSAVLASGAGDAVKLQEVSRSDLATAGRGRLIGIAGLPDSMPDPEDLVRGPVSVCSQPQQEGIETLAEVVVDIGSTPAKALPSTEGVYVESFDGDRFLLYGGERLPVAREVEAALQIGEAPAPVGSAFLTSIPMGAALETPVLEAQGEPVDIGRPLRVGQVVEVNDGTFRVVLADGLARVSDVQAKLLLTAELAGERREPIELSLSEVLDLGEGAGLGGVMAGLPEVMPSLPSQSASTVCAVYIEGDERPGFAIPAGAGGTPTPTGESRTSRTGGADRVELEPGRGMLAAAPDAKAVYYIGAPGRRYAAAGLQTLAGFGYGEVEPVVVPAELIAILPPGPAMDPAKARESAG
ncbi:type VII secretion protein EccB [Nocardioides hwasunensis]|uniref:Type VII secretion protein EccB n=1 Tax=Nocardioides hwasunensis TaxID=397258 RepID=A0ABR8MHK0_9ACTN|nr:type VII secretion protein EccB [Nocardioides hwasunensis]MBD3915530.1 type VII secretion protein EccB [Nocardioides hwasunensis]